MAVQYRAGGDIFGRLNINGSLYVNGELVEGSVPPTGFSTLTFVKELSDFPTPVNDVITLQPNHIYNIVDVIDLLGDTLVVPENVGLVGGSPQVSGIRSTGKPANLPMISGNFGVNMQNIGLTANNAIRFISPIGTQYVTSFERVNFNNCQPVGTLSGIEHILITNSNFKNCSELVFDGVIGSVYMVSDRVTTAANSLMFRLPPSLSVTRNFLMSDSAVTTMTGASSFNISPSVSVLGESIIADTVFFEGGGQHLVGLSAYDNRLLLHNNRGLQNTSSTGVFSLVSNAVATVIPNTTDFVKVAGTSVVFDSDINQRFTHTNGRLTYNGTIVRNFRVAVVAGLTCAANNQVLYIAIAKNGVVLDFTKIPAATGVGTARVEAMSTHGAIEMQQGDYVEFFVRNSTTATNVTVTDCNFLVHQY